MPSDFTVKAFHFVLKPSKDDMHSVFVCQTCCKYIMPDKPSQVSFKYVTKTFGLDPRASRRRCRFCRLMDDWFGRNWGNFRRRFVVVESGHGHYVQQIWALSAMILPWLLISVESSTWPDKAERNVSRKGHAKMWVRWWPVAGQKAYKPVVVI